MAIVIALLFLLKPVFPVIEYLANYTYITKELCVNRAKPQMHCNGKCHLMKELAKKAAEENPASEKKTGNEHYELFAVLEEEFCITTVSLTLYSLCSYTPYQNFYSHNYRSASFRPPGV